MTLQKKILFTRLFALVLAAGVAIMVGLESNKIERFKNEGITVSGIVIKKNINTNRKQVRKKYLIHFQYRDKNGTLQRNADIIAKDKWDALRVNQPVPVEYLADEPDEGRLKYIGNEQEKNEMKNFSIWGYLMAAGFFFFVPFLMRRKVPVQQDGKE